MKPEEAPSCLEQGAPLGFGAQRAVCAGCDCPISDRFLLRVDELSWHERCLRCSVCLQPLSGSCFSRHCQLYCRPDYEKLFPRRCSRCRQAVRSSERIQRVLERIFHERCLQCGACEKLLRQGDLVVLRGESLLCRRHFPGNSGKLPELPGNQRPELPGNQPGLPPSRAASPAPSESARSEDEDGANSQGKASQGSQGSQEDPKDPKRSKRPRTILTTQQRRAFKASFEVSAKPCRKVRETLAAETGLTVRVVQVWFQNQRAKMKKIARRQQQQQQQEEQLGNSRRAGRSGREGNEESEEPSAAPALEGILLPYSRIPQPLLPLEPSGFGINPPEQLQPYDSEGVFQELDGEALGSLGELLIPADSQILPGRLGNHPIGNPIGNPIDRLYSMQSSYFTS